MQFTGLAQRLWSAFFPNNTPKKTVLRRWRGTESGFFNHLNRRGFDYVIAADDTNPFVTLYTAKETGVLIGVHVRWPERNRYYTVSIT